MPEITPQNLGSPDYFESLEKQSDIGWRIWSDQNGQAGFENDGYYVRALDQKSAWISVNLNKDYLDMVLRIDVVPASHELITGYTIPFGWDETNSYYSFRVNPDGDCGLTKTSNYKRVYTDLKPAKCPAPAQGKEAQIQLEIANQKLQAFVDGNYIGTWSISSYQGGKIGLGAVYGGKADSGAETEILFKNLVIWQVYNSTNPNYYLEN